MQQLRSWIGVTFAGAGWCPLQPLQSHWMAAPLHYSSWPWPARRPSPQADQTTFPNRPAEEQLCNGVQFLCTNASLAPKVHTGLPSCQGEGGEGLLRGWWVVGKNSWQAGGIFSQLAGLLAPTGGRLLLQTPPWQKNRGRLSRFQTVAIDAALESRLGGIERPGSR